MMINKLSRSGKLEHFLQPSKSTVGHFGPLTAETRNLKDQLFCGKRKGKRWKAGSGKVNWATHCHFSFNCTKLVNELFLFFSA